MAQRPLTFTADLREFELKTSAKLDALVRQSSQEIIGECQRPQPSVKVTGGTFEVGKVPVDTGFLRNSQVTEISGKGEAKGAEAYIAHCGKAEAGDVIRAGWTAHYAPDIEFGNGRIAPRMFIGANIVKWTDIVKKIATKLAGQ